MSQALIQLLPPVHREDWRQEAGLLVPTTWDQLVAAGQQFNQLKASQNLSDAWPLCLYPTCEWVWGGGGAVALALTVSGGGVGSNPGWL